MKNAANPLHKVMIESIDGHIERAQRLRYDDIVLLLRMTKLALQMKQHDISSDELRIFCATLLRHSAGSSPAMADNEASPRPPAVIVGAATDLQPELSGRRNLLFRVQDRRNGRRRMRASPATRTTEVQNIVE